MTESMTLNIAGFIIRINFLPIDNIHLRETFIKETEKNYSGFIVKKKSGLADFTVNFVERDQIEMIYRKSQRIYYSESFRLKGSDTLETFYRIGSAQFSLLLKEVLLRILGKKDAFMLHTSSVKIGKYAFLFLAQSGGGKSTTMKMLGARYSSLADDSVIIKRENDKYYLYQTPMIEKEWWIKKDNKRHEIGMLYFVRKAKTFSEEEIVSKHEMIVRLMDQLIVIDAQKRNQIRSMMRFVKYFKHFKILSLPKDQEGLLKFFHNKPL